MMDSLATLSEKITSARLTQKKWREVSLNERINFINKFNDAVGRHQGEFISLLIAKIFKPCTYAVDEVERTVDMTTAYCEEARNVEGEVRESGGYRGFENNKIAVIKRQPLGTVLCISPFNYPLNEAVAKIVPALLMGNAVLFKPASVGFAVGELIAECMKEAGLPEGIFSLLSVFGSQFSDKSSSVFSKSVLETDKLKTGKLGSENRKQRTDNRDSLLDYIVSHPLVDCINFTGSTEVAEHISHICGIKKLVFGLSGKDASIVLKDADLELAAKEIVSGAFSYSGQRCTGIKRVLVQEDIHHELIKKLELRIKNLEVGDLSEEKTTFGPVISVKQAKFIEELIGDAENLGAKINELRIKNYELGIKRWEKQFVMPTLVDNVTMDMRIAWEEPFGPVLPVMTFKTVEDAIKMTNQSSFGLQNSVFTTNIDRAFEVATCLECGVVQINGKDARGPDNFPFLGVKKSGLGIVGGIKYLLLEMSTIKSIVINKISPSS